MKENLLKSLLSIVMILTSSFLFAHDFEVDSIYYNIISETERTVEVTFRGDSHSSYTNEYENSVRIPLKVKFNDVSYTVTSVGDSAFYSCGTLDSVTIPNSITSIGRYAFYNCTGLIAVTIGSKVSEIGYGVFDKCNAITEVYCKATTPPSCTVGLNGSYSLFPDDVINYNATLYVPQGCKNKYESTEPWSEFYIIEKDFSPEAELQDFVIDGINYKVLSGIDKTVEVTSKAGDSVYSGSVVIPKRVYKNGSTYSVIRIGKYAFMFCGGLTSITIPNSVTNIVCGAFSGCDNLKSIVVESGNTTYDSRDNCNAIVETATNKLIQGCNNTVIPNSVTSIECAAFEGFSGLTSITIPNSVTSIGVGAFRCCDGLTSIEIPNSVTCLGDQAFYECTGLIAVTIGSNVSEIGEGTFEYCDGLTSIAIPDAVTSIGDYAFRDCDGLTSITIPNSVTRLGHLAFEGCTGLSSVTIGSNVSEIGYGAFEIA